MVFAYVPEMRQGAGQLQAQLCIVPGSEAPLQGGAQVVVLGPQPVQPRPLQWPPRRPLLFLRKPQEEAGMTPTEPLPFSSHLELLQGVLTHRLKHGEAGLV